MLRNIAKFFSFSHGSRHFKNPASHPFSSRLPYPSHLYYPGLPPSCPLPLSWRLLVACLVSGARSFCALVKERLLHRLSLPQRHPPISQRSRQHEKAQASTAKIAAGDVLCYASAWLSSPIRVSCREHRPGAIWKFWQFFLYIICIYFLSFKDNYAFARQE